jgi:hypothetical protein
MWGDAMALEIGMHGAVAEHVACAAADESPTGVRPQAARQPLDAFGRFLMANLRDEALEYYDLLARGHWRAPELARLQDDLGALTARQRAILRHGVVATVDHAIHHFLLSLLEQDDGDTIRVVVGGADVAALSADLDGELYTADGWLARYSRFGEPPETA